MNNHTYGEIMSSCSNTHKHSHPHGDNHDHDHSHDHGGHGHSHVPNDKRILLISFVIITGYMFIEFAGGWYFKSLALLADAGHMANDSLALFLAFVALYFSTKVQMWAALLNGLSLIVIAIYVLIEAINRWGNPPEMMALPMLGVAIIGLLVNIGVAWLILKSDQENLNIRSAYLHVLADLLGSVVAIIAGLAAWLLNWLWVDIVASVILSIFILRSGIMVTKASFLRIKNANSDDDNHDNHNHDHSDHKH